MAKHEPRPSADEFIKPDKLRREKRRLFREVREDPKYRVRKDSSKKKPKRSKRNVTKDYLDGNLED